MRRKTVEVSERTIRYYNRSINKNNKNYIELFKLHNNLRKQLKNMTDNALYYSHYNNYYYSQYTTLLNQSNSIIKTDKDEALLKEKEEDFYSFHL